MTLDSGTLLEATYMLVLSGRIEDVTYGDGTKTVAPSRGAELEADITARSPLLARTTGSPRRAYPEY